MTHPTETAAVEALREACYKAADTFEDIGRVAHVLKREGIALSCKLAEEDIRAVLASTERAPEPDTRPSRLLQHAYDNRTRAAPAAAPAGEPPVCYIDSYEAKTIGMPDEHGSSFEPTVSKEPVSKHDIPLYRRAAPPVDTLAELRNLRSQVEALCHPSRQGAALLSVLGVLNMIDAALESPTAQKKS